MKIGPAQAGPFSTMAKIAEIALNYRQKKPEEKTSQAPINTL